MVEPVETPPYGGSRLNGRGVVPEPVRLVHENENSIFSARRDEAVLPGEPGRPHSERGREVAMGNVGYSFLTKRLAPSGFRLWRAIFPKRLIGWRIA